MTDGFELLLYLNPVAVDLDPEGFVYMQIVSNAKIK